MLELYSEATQTYFSSPHGVYNLVIETTLNYYNENHLNEFYEEKVQVLRKCKTGTWARLGQGWLPRKVPCKRAGMESRLADGEGLQ